MYRLCGLSEAAEIVPEVEKTMAVIEARIALTYERQPEEAYELTQWDRARLREQVAFQQYIVDLATHPARS